MENDIDNTCNRSPLPPSFRILKITSFPRSPPFSPPPYLRCDKSEASGRRLIRAIVDERTVTSDRDVQAVAAGLDGVDVCRGANFLADGEALPRRGCGAHGGEDVAAGLVGRHVLTRASEFQRAGIGHVGAVEDCGRARRGSGGDQVYGRARRRDEVPRRCDLDLEVAVRVLWKRAADGRTARVWPRSDKVHLVGEGVARA